jgi:hypothetical protein
VRTGRTANRSRQQKNETPRQRPTAPWPHGQGYEPTLNRSLVRENGENRQPLPEYKNETLRQRPPHPGLTAKATSQSQTVASFVRTGRTANRSHRQKTERHGKSPTAPRPHGQGYEPRTPAPPFIKHKEPSIRTCEIRITDNLRCPTSTKNASFQIL